MTSLRERLTGKAAAKPERTRRRSVRTIKGDLDGPLEDVKALAAAAQSDPYLTDATAFLTQAVVCLEKQILVEVSADRDPAKPAG